MRIQNNNDATESLKLPWMDEPVEFASTGTAQVTKEVGEKLVEQVDSISRKEDNE